jgi:CDP-diacylglycerol---serine O-phosphatidyltransferase
MLRKRRLSPGLAKQRLQAFPITRIIPNVTTLLALCTGLSGIRFVMLERYEVAVAAVLIAGILDAMDGRLARMLGATSHFGAELDSFSDFVSFGVAPGLMLYMTSLYQWGGFGWAIVLFYVICQALRLARFNTDSLKPTPLPLWAKKYSTGVPAPAGAMLALMGMMLSFAFEIPLFKSPSLSAFCLICSGLLMVSKIPTILMKGQHIDQRRVLPLMLLAGLIVAALINAPWACLFVMGILYLISIPFSYVSYKRQEQAETGKKE